MGYWLCKVCNNANDNKPVFGKPKTGCKHCGAEYGAVSMPLELAPPPVPPPEMRQQPQAQPGTVLLEDVIVAIYNDVRFIRQSIEIPAEEEAVEEAEPEPSEEEMRESWLREQDAKKQAKAAEKAAPKTASQPVAKAKPGPKPKTAKADTTVR